MILIKIVFQIACVNRNTFIAPTKPINDNAVDILPATIMIYAADMKRLFRSSISINDLSISVHTPRTMMAIPPA